MTLKEAFDTRPRGAMIKHDHFFDIYDSHLGHLRNQENFKILEIGVYNGGSLYMWRNYFPHSKVVGLDIDPYCKRWEDKNNHIKVYLGDQCDLKFLQEVVDKEGPFDLIIDDGGHENHQIITSFEFLFDYLKDGGTYVVEDTFASYHPGYDSNRTVGTNGEQLTPILKEFDKNNTSMEFLKSLTDKLSCWAYREEAAGILKQTGDLDKYEKGLWGLHFYDSIVFIDKFPRQGDKSFGEDQWYEHINKQKEYSIDPNTGKNGYGIKID
jgi:cephalosporin hydroxylase